jgi:hypothetical protein
VFHLTELTRAEFVRDVRRDGSAPSTAETSAAAVAGGAVVGGVLLGPVGAVAGGLLGSTVDYEEAGAPHYATNSVQLVFETAGGGFRMDIPRDQESAAYQFSLDVQHAMKAAGGS